MTVNELREMLKDAQETVERVSKEHLFEEMTEAAVSRMGEQINEELFPINSELMLRLGIKVYADVRVYNTVSGEVYVTSGVRRTVKEIDGM